MPCPNCGETSVSLQLNNQNVLHCPNCGGSFFEENGIDQISLENVKLLAKDKKYTQISGMDKLCPNDKAVMTQAGRSQNIPPNVVFFSCPICDGNFVYPEELIKIKSAQQSKIDYFQLWNIPLPSVKTIATLSIAIFISVLTFTGFVYWQQQNITKTRAEDLIKNIYITKSNHYLFIAFQTNLALKSKIILIDQSTKQTIEKIVSDKPVTLHQLTTSEINWENEVYYQIILMDSRGRESKSDVKKLDVR